MNNRLTNLDRDNIIIELLKPIKEDHLNKVKSLQKNINAILLSETPNKIQIFYKEFPHLMMLNTVYSSIGSLNIINIDKEGNLIKEKFLDIINTRFKKEIKELEIDNNEISILRNKLNCTLYNIKTIKSLKNEFPEAYKILQSRNSKNPKNTCTKTEEVRAILNKKLKTKGD